MPLAFDIKPTASSRLTPDEFMIDWGNVPAGAQASIFLPGVRAETILAMANKLYSRHGLSVSDAHTLGCNANGITFIPIPPGEGSNYSGLLTIDVPPAVEQGQVFKVIARQITNAFAVVPPPPPAAPARNRAAVNEIVWRRIIGTFQGTIPVQTGAALLEPEERLLSVMRWIAKTIPPQSRWAPVSAATSSKLLLAWRR